MMDENQNVKLAFDAVIDGRLFSAGTSCRLPTAQEERDYETKNPLPPVFSERCLLVVLDGHGPIMACETELLMD